MASTAEAPAKPSTLVAETRVTEVRSRPALGRVVLQPVAAAIPTAAVWKPEQGAAPDRTLAAAELGTISSITLKYKMSKYFGDPVRQAVFAYYADFKISNAFWVAQVMTTSGQPVMVNGKLVYVTWLEGSWPQPGGTYGTDSTGSPWWYETFSYYSGGAMRDGYVDETNAKAIYAAGFTLDRLRMVKINGNAVLY